MLTADLVVPDDPRWREYLAGMSHDFYHLPEYATFAALHQEPGDPIAFIADEAGLRLLVPLLIRSIPNAITKGEHLRDAISPRGYPGPLLSAPTAPASDEFLGRALDSLAAALSARGIVTAFVRLHPLYALPMERLRERGTVVEHGDSVAIDLDRSPDELWRQTRANHRRQINKAKRLGHTQRIDDDWERLDAFVIAYGQSMDRLGAAAHWRLSRDYFEDLRTSLGDRVHLCVDEDGDQLTAAALLIEEDGIVEYHLAGTMDRYVHASPSKSIIDFAWRWSKARGNRVLHLAGSLSPGDSLSRFKSGFSPLQYPVCSWRLTSDVSAYERLCQAWRDTSGVDPDQPAAFFPAYRQPVAPQATSTDRPA